MKKRAIPKTSKRRLVIFGTISCILIGYAIFTIVFYSYNLTKITKENKNLEEQLSELQTSEEDLRLEILKLKDPEYVARYARENYSYSKDGEYIIKIDKQEEKIKEEKQENNDNYYIVGGILIILILISIIIKIFKGKTKTV